ncbi:MAG: metallophosphoesterase [Paludibacter sp.]|nr:metallophosphoesterase [Paludibacter sp.]
MNLKLKLFIFITLIFTGFNSCINDLLVSPVEELIIQKSDTSAVKNSIHFFVLSDWGFNGSVGQRAVANSMANTAKITGLDFILTCGDNFQYQGVQSATDLLWNINYANVYNQSALNVPWYPALGNHDYAGNPDAQIEYSSVNKNWNLPSRYYTFTKKINEQAAIRFVVMDTQGFIKDVNNLTDANKIESIKQYAWLKNILIGNRDKWLIITGHHPVYSSGYYHGDTPELKKFIKPLFDQYKVDFYICGHDHQFEHAKEPYQYTDYIVTGTGGLPRTTGKSLNTLFSLTSLGFTYINAHSNFLKLYFITEEGRVAYRFEKIKEISKRR